MVQALSSRLLSRAAAAAAAEEPPLSPGTTLLPEDTGPRGGRDLYRYIADELPWQRVTIWTVVAWLAYQLHDFFGVRLVASHDASCLLGKLTLLHHQGWSRTENHAASC